MNARRIFPASRRAGLAPLELVLWLPVLLSLLALMVILGNGGVWKLRTADASRHSMWRERPGRTGRMEDPPSNFPAGGRTLREPAADLDDLADPRIDLPVVRGPLANFDVQRDLLDPARGAHQGRAQLVRDYPMLGRMGDYNFDVATPLLDDQFRYWEMGIPVNRMRRIPFIYRLPQTDAGLKQAFTNAGTAMLTSGARSQWLPLDREEELRAWFGNYFDFYPRVRRFCELDVESVRQNEIEELIRRIQGNENPGVPSVPENMVTTFLSMYRQQLAMLRARPNPPQAQIDALERLIDQYQQYLDQLRNNRPQRGP